MKKIFAVMLLLILIVALSSTSWFIYTEVGGLQNQNTSLSKQNSELQQNNATLQNLISDLKLQVSEQQKRLKDLTYQLALERPLLVKITDVKYLDGNSPIGGMALANSANVTIQNNDVVPLFGLKLWVSVYKDASLTNRIDYGSQNDVRIERIDAGKTVTFTGFCYTTAGVSPRDLSGYVCVATLTAENLLSKTVVLATQIQTI